MITIKCGEKAGWWKATLHYRFKCCRRKTLCRARYNSNLPHSHDVLGLLLLWHSPSTSWKRAIYIYSNYTITHFCFHKKAKQGCSNHHKDISVQNWAEVIQTGDCARYPRTEGLSCFPMLHSGHNAPLFEAQKSTEALQKDHFSNMYHEPNEGYENASITVIWTH